MGSVSVEEMNEHFMKLLEGITPSPGVVKLFRTIVKRTAATKLDNVNHQLEARRVTLVKIDKDISMSIQRFLNGSLSKAEKDMFQESKRLERIDCEREIDRLEGVQRLNEATIDRVCDFIDAPMKLWLDSDSDTKRVFQKMVIPTGAEFDIKERKFGTVGLSPLYRLESIKKDPSESKESLMVSHVDITWNSFLPYLIQLTNKLEALGFRYVDNKVIILQEKADEK